jgi:hypothetical protein
MLPVFCMFLFFKSNSQKTDSIFSFMMAEDVKLTFDNPASFSKHKKTILVFYALPNGNTTEQTMGKKIQPGDDWHFDIQHIRAQTKFTRQQLPRRNVVVVYLENNLKSWPAWKQKHPDHLSLIQHIVDTLYHSIRSKQKIIYLNGHSGGGSFIFGFMAGVEKIPAYVKRISFLDSDYGYDSSYYAKMNDWLHRVKDSHLTVFAYNDSVALYNGKPVVSATGGTWYRSHLMMNDLSRNFSFEKREGDSITSYESDHKTIGFFFKMNLNRGIYHTQQVELNGFIHSIFFGTKKESEGYTYYGSRAYSQFIQ